VKKTKQRNIVVSGVEDGLQAGNPEDFRELLWAFTSF
jgi:hypothetical protein